MIPKVVQYDVKTDTVIYGSSTEGFERIDWLRLAAAAIDQAGITGSLARTLEKLISDEEPEPEEAIPIVEVVGARGPIQLQLPARSSSSLRPCPVCTSDPSRNFPKGMIYVGSGSGWAKCSRCGGTGEIAEADGGGP